MDDRVEHTPPTPGERLQLSVECGILLYAPAAFLGAFVVWQHNPDRFQAYLPALAVPASATIAFVLIGTLAPGLLAVGRLRFPLNLTLPAVFAGLLLAAAKLWTTSAVAVVAIRDVLVPALIWQDAGAVLLLAVVQCAFLSGAIALRSH